MIKFVNFGTGVCLYAGIKILDIHIVNEISIYITIKF